MWRDGRAPRAACAAGVVAAGIIAGIGAARGAEPDDTARRLFTRDATPPCALCHTLADAGATGNVGPSLDELKPDAARVAQAVRTGFGAMPPYPKLSDDEVQALARYVARASGGAR